MRKTILLTTIIFLTFSFTKAQGFQEINGKSTYIKVYEVNKSKIEIYKALKLWLNETSNKSKNFIDLDDSDLGLISFNMISKEYPINKYQYDRIRYKVTVEMKENKMRVKASDFVLKINIAGLSLTRDFEQLSDSLSIKNDISDLKERLASTKKKRKIGELKEEINDKKSELELTKRALSSFEKSIYNLFEELKETINNYKDF